MYTVHEDEDFINITVFSYISVTTFDEIMVNFTTFGESAIEGKLRPSISILIPIESTTKLFDTIPIPYYHASTSKFNTGEDYLELALQIPITGNQSTAVISIPIMNDYLAEGLETFGGMLEVMSQSQNLSFVSIIHIEIIDNEGNSTNDRTV